MLDFIAWLVNPYLRHHLIIFRVWFQLQHLVCDDICVQCMDLYIQEKKTDGGGGLCATAMQRSTHEATYQRKAELKLTDENCYKIHTVSVGTVGFFKFAF